MKKKIALLSLIIAFSTMVFAQDHTEFKWRGFYSVIDYSHGFNLNKKVDTVSFNSLTFVAGFSFFKESALGGGVTLLADTRSAFTSMPIFVELRSHWTRDRFTPFSVLQVGYNLPLGTESEGPASVRATKGGLYFALQGGGRYAINRSLGISPHVGLRFVQYKNVRRNDNDWKLASEEPEELLFLDFGIGVNF